MMEYLGVLIMLQDLIQLASEEDIMDMGIMDMVEANKYLTSNLDMKRTLLLLVEEMEIF